MYVCIYTTTGASYPPPLPWGGGGGGEGGGVGTRDTGPYIYLLDDGGLMTLLRVFFLQWYVMATL